VRVEDSWGLEVDAAEECKGWGRWVQDDVCACVRVQVGRVC